VFVAGATYVALVAERPRPVAAAAAPSAPAPVNPTVATDAATVATPDPGAVSSGTVTVVTTPAARDPEPGVVHLADPVQKFPSTSEVRTSGLIVQPPTGSSSFSTAPPPFAPPVPVSALLPVPPPTTPPALVTSSTFAIPGEPKAEALQPPQEPLVRSTVARYAQAYNALDVDAVERVWPSVNRDALTRAFDSLASQRVTLGDCRIQLDGDTAEATCAGWATWTPKVGREQTDARHWTFDLEKSAAGWQIINARVQNR